jgi:hypothetical protein
VNFNVEKAVETVIRENVLMLRAELVMGHEEATSHIVALIARAREGDAYEHSLMLYLPKVRRDPDFPRYNNGPATIEPELEYLSQRNYPELWTQ